MQEDDPSQLLLTISSFTVGPNPVLIRVKAAKTNDRLLKYLSEKVEAGQQGEKLVSRFGHAM
jgi:hypothetical protein